MVDTDVTDNPRMFPALRLLERVTPPTLYGHQPFWRAPVTAPSKTVLVPSWNWRHVNADTIPEGDSPITLDVNGAFLAAVGSVEVAHSQLRRMGPIDAYRLDPRKVWPGYYRVDVFGWGLDATLVSPLGDSARLQTEGEAWIAHPTLVLLLELLNEGAIGDLNITDAWVSERRCNFRAWNAKLKEHRNKLLDDVAKGETEAAIAAAKLRYRAFKEGYGAAFSMMLTGERCQTRRPDWAHAVYAQHAATAWRKAWRFTLTGPVLSMGAVDEITVLRSDLHAAVLQPKPPVKLDPSGRTLGHLKEKTKEDTPREEDADPTLIMSEDWSDLL